MVQYWVEGKMNDRMKGGVNMNGGMYGVWKDEWWDVGQSEG